MPLRRFRPLNGELAGRPAEWFVEQLLGFHPRRQHRAAPHCASTPRPPRTHHTALDSDVLKNKNVAPLYKCSTNAASLLASYVVAAHVKPMFVTPNGWPAGNAGVDCVGSIRLAPS